MPESYYRRLRRRSSDAVLDFMRENRKDVAEYRAKTDFTVVAQRALYLKPGGSGCGWRAASSSPASAIRIRASSRSTAR